MCNLNGTIENKEFYGYKLVAKKDGQYYSLAFGFPYSLRTTFGRVKSQNRISYYFNRQITEAKHFGWRKRMIGRSAAYINRTHARMMKKKLKTYYIKAGYSIVMVRVKVSGDCMQGTYNGFNVVAGNVLEIIKEVR